MATRIVSSTVTGYTIRPGCAAERLHQADVVFSLHGYVGHGGHDAERGEDQDDHDGGIEQAADAVVDLSLSFGELADAVDVGFGKTLGRVGNVVADCARSPGDADLDQADPSGHSSKALHQIKRCGDLIVFGAAARRNEADAAAFRACVTP